MRTKFVGAAGSGKTRAVLEKIIELCDDPHEVSFASMTNAAKDEITRRVADYYGCTIPSLTAAHWRTTHSTAIRGLGGRYDVLHDGTAEYRKAIRPAGFDVSRAGAGFNSGAMALMMWNRARASGVPLRCVWSDMRRVYSGLASLSTIVGYVNRYEAAKAADGWIDLTDALMRFAGVRQAVDGRAEDIRPEGEVPEGVRVLVLDEAQDASYLIYRVQKRLEDECGPEHLILAADPYQSIFSFTGGDPRYFLDWEVDETIVMERSWRCAEPIFSLGHRCLSGTAGYVDYGIKPAEHEGFVARAGSIGSAFEKCGDGTVMLLARTNQRAEEMADELGVAACEIGVDVDREAVGFKALHHVAAGDITSAVDFASAVSMLPAKGFFDRGAKAKWARMEYVVSEVLPWRLRDYGVTEEGERMIRDGSWVEHVGNQKKALQWRANCAKFGADEATKPRVKFGTIHASKGLEADAVIVDDSLPKATAASIRHFSKSRDEERRVSYVGVTRGRRACVVLSAAGQKERAKWMR